MAMSEIKDRKKQVKDWITRIDLAEKTRENWRSEWEKNYKAVFGKDWLRGDFKSVADWRSDTHDHEGAPPSIKGYQYDKLLAFLKTELPSLVLYFPEVYLSASDWSEEENPEAEKMAKLLESRTNYVLQQIDDYMTEVRVELADAFCAYAIEKTIPRYEIGPHPQAGQPVIDEQTGTPLMDPVTQQPLIWPEEEVKQTGYDKCRVSPFRFLVDERTRNNGSRASWRGEEIWTTLEKIKSDRFYDDASVAELEKKFREKVANSKSQDWEIEVKLYEVYDRVNKKIIVICREFEDDFIRYDDTPKGIDGDPYSTLKLTEIPGQWVPKPEISGGRLLQHDYLEGRKWQRSWAQKCNPQIGVTQSFDEALPDEVRRLGDGVTEVIKVRSQSDVFMIQKDMPHVNPGLEQHMALCQQDFDEIMGQSTQSRGLVGKAKFATEAEIAEQSSDVRTQDKLMLVKKFFIDGVHNLLNLMKHNPDEPQVIRDILQKIEVTVEIDIESKTPKNRAIERKQMIDAAKVFPPLMQSPTFIEGVLRTFELRELAKIMQEIKASQQPKGKAEKPISMSMPIPFELLPKESAAQIVQMIAAYLSEQVPQPQEQTQPGGNGGRQPNTSESVGAGTEGMSPGSGMRGGM